MPAQQSRRHWWRQRRRQQQWNAKTQGNCIFRQMLSNNFIITFYTRTEWILFYLLVCAMHTVQVHVCLLCAACERTLLKICMHFSTRKKCFSYFVSPTGFSRDILCGGFGLRHTLHRFYFVCSEEISKFIYILCIHTTIGMSAYMRLQQIDNSQTK